MSLHYEVMNHLQSSEPGSKLLVADDVLQRVSRRSLILDGPTKLDKRECPKIFTNRLEQRNHEPSIRNESYQMTWLVKRHSHPLQECTFF